MSKSIFEKLVVRADEAFCLIAEDHGSSRRYQFFFSIDRSTDTREVYSAWVHRSHISVERQVIQGTGDDCVMHPVRHQEIENTRGTRKLKKYIEDLCKLYPHEWPEGVRVDNRGKFVWIDRDIKTIKKAA